MDPRFPLSRLTLEARSVVDELSFVALHDVAEVARRLGVEHRLIGAHMVTLHAYRWGLGAELYRETRDVDLGVPLEVARDPALIGALEETGYRRSAGNRLVRSIADVPVEVEAPGAEATREAAVDVLIPAYTSRARDNVRVGEHLTTTEVGGLAEALRRQPVQVRLQLGRLNGQTLEVDVLLPDEVSVVILRALVWRRRGAGTDAVDLWRSLEIAIKAGLRPGDFSSETARTAAEIIRTAFLGDRAPAVGSIVTARGSSAVEAARLRTRLKALADRVVGTRRGS
ncbi:MAG: hypothetical protein ACRDHV_01450 [Actinomycetota bacterium]